MNIVDVAIIGLVLLSGLLGLLRGLVWEGMKLIAWVVSAIAAVALFSHVLPTAQQYVHDAKLAELTAFLLVFVACFILLSVVAGLIGQRVQASLLGPADRTLGFLFGLVRGAALVVAAYILLGIAIAPEGWPLPLRQAGLRPTVQRGADWVVAQVPPDYRPYLGPASDTPPAAEAEPVLIPLSPPGQVHPSVPFGHPDNRPPSPPRSNFGPGQ